MIERITKSIDINRLETKHIGPPNANSKQASPSIHLLGKNLSSLGLDWREGRIGEGKRSPTEVRHVALARGVGEGGDGEGEAHR